MDFRFGVLMVCWWWFVQKFIRCRAKWVTPSVKWGSKSLWMMIFCQGVGIIKVLKTWSIKLHQLKLIYNCRYSQISGAWAYNPKERLSAVEIVSILETNIQSIQERQKIGNYSETSQDSWITGKVVSVIVRNIDLISTWMVHMKGSNHVS